MFDTKRAARTSTTIDRERGEKIEYERCVRVAIVLREWNLLLSIETIHYLSSNYIYMWVRTHVCAYELCYQPFSGGPINNHCKSQVCAHHQTPKNE